MSDDPKPRGYATLREAMAAIVKHEEQKRHDACHAARKKQRFVVVTKRSPRPWGTGR
jgi:hypothetical protein